MLRLPAAGRTALGLTLVVLAAGGALALVLRAGDGGDGSNRNPSFNPRLVAQFVRHEKLGGENGKDGGEGQREGADSPAVMAARERAFPRKRLEPARGVAARAAFQRVPRRAPIGARRAPSARGLAASPSTLSSAWQQLGPTDGNVPAAVSTFGGNTQTSGRVTAMAIAPTCAPGNCRLWVAAAGGGIWRTDDAKAPTPVWTPIDNGLTTGAFSALAVDPQNPNVIYAGSGEPNGAVDSEAGDGLFKSTDGGDHWTRLASTVDLGRGNAIGTIVIAPPKDANDTQHIYIGTAPALGGITTVGGGDFYVPNAGANGVFQSTDGGSTFTTVVQSTAGNDWWVNRIEVDPADPAILYVARLGAGIWRIGHTADTGTQPHQVFKPLHPGDSSDRTEFDLVRTPSGSPHTRMYVGDGDSTAAQFWRLDATDQPANVLVTTGNNATHWNKLSSAAKTDPGWASHDYCHTQCFYDNVVVADPQQPDTVYLGGSMNYDDYWSASPTGNGQTVMRSKDGGTTFTDMTLDAASPRTGMHPDQHALVLDPGTPDGFFAGSDGGVVRSGGAVADASSQCAGQRQLSGDDLTVCEQLLSKVPGDLDPINGGLATLQFGSLAVNPASPLNDVMGGTQDNGTWERADAGSWQATIGGDGGMAVIDSSGARIHTFTGADMDVNHDRNNPSSWIYISGPLAASGEKFSFYAPLAGSPAAPGTAFIGGQHVWRTQANGGSEASLTALHCGETDPAFPSNASVCGDWQPLGTALGSANNPLAVVAPAPGDKTVLWAATFDGKLYVSRNADAPAASVTFQPVTDPSLPGRFPSAIVVDPQDPLHAWVSFSGYSANTPSKPGHVFEVRLSSSGALAGTPVNLDHGLDDLPITALARDDGTGDLYAGTDFGVLRLASGATTWTQAAAGLPVANVAALTTASSSRLLYVATHGRGAYRVSLPAIPAPGDSGGGTPNGGDGSGGTGGGGGGSPTPSTSAPATSTPAAATPTTETKSPVQQTSRRPTTADIARSLRVVSLTAGVSVGRDGRVRLVVLFPRTVPSQTGTAIITLSGSQARAAKTVRLGTVRFKAIPGKKVTVRVKLSSAGRKLLAKRRKLKVRIQLEVKDVYRRAITKTVTVTLKQAKPKAKRGARR